MWQLYSRVQTESNQFTEQNVKNVNHAVEMEFSVNEAHATLLV
jgi:hypothetical protein